MPEVIIYNSEKLEVGKATLSPRVFEAEPNVALIHQVAVQQQRNRRQGTAAVKHRALVAGGGAKPYRQKGTGRARQGSIRAPHYRGGGIVFGPQPKDYNKSVPKKMRQAALRQLLSDRLREGRVVVIDKLVFAAPKTKQMAELLERLELTGRVLIVDAEQNQNAVLSTQNLALGAFVAARNLNVMDVLYADSVLITQEALLRIEESLAP